MTGAARHSRRSILAVACVALFATAGLLLPHPLAAEEAPAQAAEHEVAKLAKGKFLVASRDLLDPNFARSVVLLVEYDRDGALGVIINRPTTIPLGDAVPEIESVQRPRDVIFLGGPVAPDRMLILLRTREQPPQSLRVFDRVFASGSVAALRASLQRGDGVRAFAGYAGWGPGQLDNEVARGDWLIGPAESDALFAERPDGIWERLIERLSGNWALLRQAFRPQG